MFDLDLSGQTAVALWKNGRTTATDVVTGATREWAEPGTSRVGFQAKAPTSSALACTAIGKDSTGPWVVLKVQSDGDGGAPVTTGISMEGVRDLSIHPDGRCIAFNAGWRSNEHWAMENLLAT